MPPRVFISYSQESGAHKERVLALANKLRADGIDANIDQYVRPYPPEGWEEWSEAQVRTGDFIVMICTPTYLERFNRDAPAGEGHGVLWEAKAIRALLYNAGGASRKLVPVFFNSGQRAHVPLPLQGGYIDQIDTHEGYGQLYRLLTGQPDTPKPELGKPGPRSKGGEHRKKGYAYEDQIADRPHPRVGDLFVGRLRELAQLRDAIFPEIGRRHPVAVFGMPGVGKSYLVDRFYSEHLDRFPGGYVKIPLVLDGPDLLDKLGQHQDLRGAGDNVRELRARLLVPLTLVHIENADTFEAGRVVGEAAATLPDCALVISARFRDLGFAAAWSQIPLLPFDETTALQQLSAELGPEAPDRQSWPALAAALGYLPLALHLAAGHMRAGDSAKEFLKRLYERKLALTGVDPTDPVFRPRSRALLSDIFDLSFAALQREGGEAWRDGFASLGHAPAEGFVRHLGAAITGLAPVEFGEMVRSANRLCLLDRVPRGTGSAFRLHPLIAQLLRLRADRKAAIERRTEWCVKLILERTEDQMQLLEQEFAAVIEWLAEWLAQVAPPGTAPPKP
jgi:hypothetical protein